MRSLRLSHISTLLTIVFLILGWLSTLSRAQEDAKKDQSPTESAPPAVTASTSPGSETKPAEAAPAASTSGPSNGDLKIMADTVWTLLTGMLVFFMNLGFACVESGF